MVIGEGVGGLSSRKCVVHLTEAHHGYYNVPVKGYFLYQ